MTSGKVFFAKVWGLKEGTSKGDIIGYLQTAKCGGGKVRKFVWSGDSMTSAIVGIEGLSNSKFKNLLKNKHHLQNNYQIYIERSHPPSETRSSAGQQSQKPESESTQPPTLADFFPPLSTQTHHQQECSPHGAKPSYSDILSSKPKDDKTTTKQKTKKKLKVDHKENREEQPPRTGTENSYNSPTGATPSRNASLVQPQDQNSQCMFEIGGPGEKMNAKTFLKNKENNSPHSVPSPKSLWGTGITGREYEGSNNNNKNTHSNAGATHSHSQRFPDGEHPPAMTNQPLLESSNHDQDLDSHLVQNSPYCSSVMHEFLLDTTHDYSQRFDSQYQEFYSENGSGYRQYGSGYNLEYGSSYNPMSQIESYPGVEPVYNAYMEASPSLKLGWEDDMYSTLIVSEEPQSPCQLSDAHNRSTGDTGKGEQNGLWPDLGPREDSEEVDMSSTSTTATVKVENVGRKLKKTTLEHFFRLEDHGGGEISSISVIGNAAYITFKSTEVAKRVATRSEFHVEDCILKTSLSQRRPDPLDHILQLCNPDNTIVLTDIPESVCDEHLEAHIDAETGLRAEEHYKLRKRCDSLALVVLPPHYSGQLHRVFKILLQSNRLLIKSPPTLLTVKPLAPVRTVYVSDFNKEPEVLQGYFSNRKKSGGGRVEQLRMVSKNQALVTFHEPAAVQTILTYDHTSALGSDVTVQMYQPVLSRLFQIPDVDIPEMDIPLQRYDSLLHHLSKPLYRHIRKHGFATLLQNQLSKMCAKLSLDEENSTFMIHPQSGSEWISDWTSRVCQEIYAFTAQFQEISLEIPEDIASTIYPVILESVRESEVTVSLSPSSGEIVLVGSPQNVKDVEQKVREIIHKNLDVSKEESFPPEILLFVKTCIHKELKEKHKQVIFEIDLLKGVLEVRGKRSGCEEFLKEVGTFKLAVVQVNVPKEIVHFYASPKGRNILNKKINQGDVTYFFTDENGSMSHNATRPKEGLHLLGPTNEKVSVFSSDLKEYLQLYKVPVPEEFNKMATEGDDWVWNQTREDLEAKYTCALLPVGEAINIVCEPQCASAITKEVEDMIKETCYKEAKVQIPKGNWLYLTKYCKEWTKLCNEIEQAKIRLSPSDETISTITFYGEISPVKRFFSLLHSLSNRVVTEHVKTSKPGMAKYFLSKSGRDQLEGIGAKHNAVVEIASQSEEDKRSKFTKVTGHSIVCRASAAHGIRVHIVLGDLTTFPVDVIVNAANDHLQHVGGVARALSKKGGKVIQGESSCYVKKYGSLPIGDAVLMKHVGKLDCKAIIHAVGPPWYGGDDHEESCLRKAVCESLSACAGEKYETIAFPAIGAGIFKVPEDICAQNMIKAVKEFSRCNAKCSIRNISIVLLQPSIAGQFCKFSKMLLSDVVLDSSFENHLYDIMPRWGLEHYDKEDVGPLSVDRSSSTEEVEDDDQIDEDEDLSIENEKHSDVDNKSRVVGQEPKKELQSVAIVRTSPQESPIDATGEETPRSESSDQMWHRGPSPGTLKSTHVAASSCPVILKKGSITDVVADACVNSAHGTLNLTKGSISLAFLRAGGHELQRKCDEYVQLNGLLHSGEIAVTDSPSLSSLGCRYVIHTVGKAYDGTGGSAEQVLRQSIFKVLNECDRRNVSVVAFPALGTGNLAFPPSESATIMLDVFTAYFTSTTSRSLKSILVVIQDTPVYSAFQRVFASSQLSQNNPSTPDTSLMSAKVKSEVPLHTDFGRNLASGQLSQNTSYPFNIPVEANMKCEKTLYFVSKHVKVVLVRGDITRDDSEGIICSNSPSLMRPQGLMGTLLVKGGQQLQRECSDKYRNEGPLQSGQVILTGSGRPGGLKCEHILHIPVPHTHSELQTGVKNALNVADRERLSSVAMPAIGTGGNQIPLQHVAQSLCNAIVAFTYSSPSHVKLIKVFLLEERLWTMFSYRFSLMFGNAKGTSSKVPINQPMSHPLRETSTEYPQLAYSPSTNIFSSTDVSVNKHPGLCIAIHTGSQETMRKVRTEVNAAIEDNYSEERVKNFKKLPASMEAELKQLAEHRTVELVCMHSGEILLKGSKRDVDPLKSEIQDKLHAVERAESRQKEAELMTAKFQWKWKDELGTLHNYDPMVNLNIEEAHHQKRENCRVKVCSDRGTREGAIDLERMIETDQTTAKCFSVVRHIVEKERVEDDRPTTWTPMPLDEQGKEVECHVVELSLDSEEYRLVKNEFLQTIGSPSAMRSRFYIGYQSEASTWEIIGIKRIQNPKLYSQYMARKRAMEKSIDRGRKYERRLYHGCAEDVVDSINHSGFNRSFAGKNATAYGKGVYFATAASISASDRYSTPDMFDRKRMYLARVLVGEYAVGNSSMVTPPLKKQSVQYDSVVNNIVTPTIFVIFYDAQVYPEYLIQFRKVPTARSYLY